MSELFVLTATDAEQKERLYWLCFALWQSKSFYPYHRGTAVQFVILRDVKHEIEAAAERMQNNFQGFCKAVETLRQLQHQEQKFFKCLQLVKEAKQSVGYHFLRR